MKIDPLCSLSVAAEALGIGEDDIDGLAEAIASNGIRTVSFKGESYLLGADVARAVDDKDPRKLAAKLPRL